MLASGVDDSSSSLNTAVSSTDVQTTRGGIFTNETDAMQLGDKASVTP